jgi:TPR repeat protein
MRWASRAAALATLAAVGCVAREPSATRPRPVMAVSRQGVVSSMSPCDGGYGAGCVVAGVARDDPRAPTGDGQACYAGNADVCTQLGNMLYGQDDARAVEFYVRACNGASADGCSDLGDAYREGRGVARDVSRALSFYERACDLGESSTCGMLGNWYRLGGDGVAPNNDRAAESYARACRAGNAETCDGLGDAYRLGEGTAQDDSLAAHFYEQACKGGYPIGCAQLAKTYELGLGSPKDDARALALFKAAGDTTEGATGLGRMYQYGRGIGRDEARAGELFKSVCDEIGTPEQARGLPRPVGAPPLLTGPPTLPSYACGEVWLRGLGVKADRARAVLMFRQACAKHPAAYPLQGPFPYLSSEADAASCARLRELGADAK